MELAKINIYSVSSGYLRFIPVTLFFLSFLLISCADQKVPDKQRAYLTKLDTLIAFGIALIHHMTYEDAEYTFNQVIELDKDCFWGYWGKAMTYIHPLWPDVPDSALLEKGYLVSQNALSLAKTKKEKLYGAALASFYEDGLNKSKQARLDAFKNGWMTAREELPEDIEARMFSVLTMLATVSPYDKSYKVKQEKLLKKFST